MIPRWALAGGVSLAAHVVFLAIAPSDLRPGEPASLLSPDCRIRYPDQPPSAVSLDRTYPSASARPRRIEIRQRRTIHLPAEPWPPTVSLPLPVAAAPRLVPARPEPDWEQTELLASLGPAATRLTAVGTTHGRLWLARARDPEELLEVMASRLKPRTGPLAVLLAFEWELVEPWEPLSTMTSDFPFFEEGTEGGLTGASLGNSHFRETSPLIPSFEQEGRPESPSRVAWDLPGWLREEPDGTIIVLPKQVTAAFEARLPEALAGWNKLVALPRLWAAGSARAGDAAAPGR